MHHNESANQKRILNDQCGGSANRTQATGCNRVASFAKRTMIKIRDSLSLATFVTIFALMQCVRPSHALGETSMAGASPQQTSRLIQQLDAAKSADWNAALDPDVSPVRRGTFLNQMNKADRAAEKLRHGFAVPKAEITDALWAPPKHISSEERAELIQELKQAKQRDDQKEQNMLNDEGWSRSASPADTMIFDERERQIDALVMDLQIGAPVHWSAIKDALVVPASPY